MDSTRKSRASHDHRIPAFPFQPVPTSSTSKASGVFPSQPFDFKPRTVNALVISILFKSSGPSPQTPNRAQLFRRAQLSLLSHTRDYLPYSEGTSNFDAPTRRTLYRLKLQVNNIIDVRFHRG